MRSYPNIALRAAAMMALASMAVVVPPREEPTEPEPDAPPPPEKPKSLPGETNRQFAARMKAEGVKP